LDLWKAFKQSFKAPPPKPAVAPVPEKPTGPKTISKNEYQQKIMITAQMLAGLGKTAGAGHLVAAKSIVDKDLKNKGVTITGMTGWFLKDWFKKEKEAARMAPKLPPGHPALLAYQKQKAAETTAATAGGKLEISGNAWTGLCLKRK
jgi:hypothetical protein